MKHLSTPHMLPRLLFVGIFLTSIILLVVVPRALHAPVDIEDAGSRPGETGLEAPTGKSSLTGGTWELYRFDDTSVPDSMRGMLTLSLSEEGKLEGKLCNTFSGTYKISAGDTMKGTLTATDITATKIYCAGPEMKAETALFAELAKGAKFEITTGSLTFPTRAGTPLEFTKRIEWY